MKWHCPDAGHLFSLVLALFNASKPDIRIKFFENEPDNETLWISIDFYSGLFHVFLPDEFPASKIHWTD